jgi:hypothetical protein
MHEVYGRRLEVTERFLAEAISQSDRAQFAAYVQKLALSALDITVKEAEERNRIEKWELCGKALNRMVEEAKAEEKEGRITGDVEWKRSRGELGNASHCASDGEFSKVMKEYSAEALQKTSRIDASGRLQWLVPNLMTSTGNLTDVMMASSGFEDPNDLFPIRALDPWQCIFTKDSSAYSSTSVQVNDVAVCRGARGHNVVVVDLCTGSVYDSVSFDTWQDRTAGAKLCAHINYIKPSPNQGEAQPSILAPPVNGK